MPLILGTNSIKDTGYDVANSCRFNAPDDAYMHKTPSSDGSRRIGTFSIWIKPALNTSEGQYLFSGSPDATTETSLGLSIDGDDLRFNGWTGNSQHMLLVTDRKFRDPSAWYHIVVAWDTTQATASNRVKIYVNGVQETSFSTETYPDEDRDLNINNASNKTLIGARSTANYAFGDGYYSEVVMIDGTALAPTSFGEFDEDSGIWKPIDVSGLTFGTNGFYLDFKDSSNLGNDANGGTDFTEVNLAATDQSTDTCTNNFATFNPLYKGDSVYSEGNLKNVFLAADHFGGVSTIGVATGKWYAEFKILTDGGEEPGVGITGNPQLASNTNQGVGEEANSIGYRADGSKGIEDTFSSYGASYTTNDIIGVALDLTSGTQTITFYKNGASQGAITISLTPADGVWFMASNSLAAGPANWEANFGSPPFAISSGNTDGNGYGNFEYAVPSGYFSLNTKNLAEYG